MNLDVQTLMTVVTVSYLSGALVLAALAASVASVSKTVRFGWALWAVCLLLAGISTTLISQRDAISDFWSIVAANALLITSFGLSPNATALLRRKKMPFVYLPLVGMAVWLGLFYGFEVFRNDTALRVYFVNGFCLIGILLCLRESLQLNRKQVSSWLLTLAFVLDAGVRVSLMSPYFRKSFPALLDSYETAHLKICILSLIVTIVIKIVGITLSIFEVQRLEYQQEAERDPLTGLLNQRGFTRQTQAALARPSANGQTYALALLEIDDLAQIEQRYGNSMRDACIKLLARITGLTLPAGTLAGLDRNGQVALFLPKSDQTEALSYIRRISQILVSESRQATAGQVSVSLSCGIFSGVAGTPVTRALEIADHCCRKAQAQGGNKIMTHSAADDGTVTANAAEPPFARRPKGARLKVST